MFPRIVRTSLARHSLRSHQLSLLRRLTASLAALKESQAESLAILPRFNPFKELSRYAQCKSVSDVVAIAGEKGSSVSTIPPITLLRCAITDCGEGKEDQYAKPSAEDLFRYLESQISWLASEEGLKYEVCAFLLNGVISHKVKIAKAVGHTFDMPTIQQYFE